VNVLIILWLFPVRPNDHSSEGFLKWEFMTTHCWGEKPAGDWILDIRDTPSPRRNSRLQGAYHLNTL